MSAQTIDWAAKAKEYGAVGSTPAAGGSPDKIDWAARARQYGAVGSQPVAAAAPDTGVLASLKRSGSNLLHLPGAVYNAFTKEATPEEETAASTIARMHNIPQPAALAMHRLIVAPMAEKGKIADQAIEQYNTLTPEQQAVDRQNDTGLYHTAMTNRIASMVPLVGPMAEDITHRYLSGDKSGAMTDLATILAAPKITEGATKLALRGTRAAMGVSRPVPPVEATLPPTGAIRGAVRSYMGIGPKMAERTATEAMGEHAESVAATQEANAAKLAKHETAVSKIQARQAQLDAQAAEASTAATREMVKKQSASYAETEHTNQLAAAEHAEEVQRINNLNKAGEEAVGERSRLGQQITDNSTQLNPEIKSLEQRVRAEGQAKYQAVSAATEGDTIPATKLSDAVNHANKNLIQGTPESIKQFNDLLQKGEPQDVATSVGTATPGTPLYETLVREGAIQPTESLAFRDLQGYYTELGQKMMAQNIPGDVYRALKYVRDEVGKEMQAMAERHGAGDVLNDARAHWRQYEQTFHDMRPVARGGSPVARALRAADPGYTAAPFLGKSAARAVDMLDKYDPNTAMRAARIASDYDRMSGLPRKFTPKEVPEAPAVKLPKIYEKPEPQQAKQLEVPKAPEPAQPESAPDLGKAIQEAREARVGKISSNLRSVSGWDVASVSGGLYQIARGELPSAFGITVLRHGIGAVLDHPSVVRWLSAPTREDFAAFDRIPSEQRAAVQQAVTDVYVKQAQTGKPLQLNDAARRFLTPAQVKQIDNSTSAPAPVANGQITPEHIAIENAFYTQARAKLGADASPSAVLQRAQALKAEHAAKGAPPPTTPVPPTFKTSATASIQRPSAPSTASLRPQATAIMMLAKQGQITPAEADSRIQRLVGSKARKTIRMPTQPE
jgi:hypothetical protein